MENNRIMKFQRWVAAFLVLMVLSMDVSGCTAFRRKFVRKNKNKDAKEAFIPVLEPIEYQPVVHAPIKTYTTHYSVVRAYYKDVWETLGKNENVKRERYLLAQVSAKLQAMALLLTGEMSVKLKTMADKVGTVSVELDKPQALRRYDLMKSDLKAVERDLYRSFKPALIGSFLAVPGK